MSAPAAKRPSLSKLSAVERRQQKAMRKRAKRKGLTPEEMNRIRLKVERVTCSEPWTDHVVSRADACGVNPLSTKIPQEIARLGIYPPPADTAPMVECPQCRYRTGLNKAVRKFPPQYVRPEMHNPLRGRKRIMCEECHAAEFWKSFQFLKQNGLIPGIQVTDDDNRKVSDHIAERSSENAAREEPLEIQRKLVEIGLSSPEAELLVLLSRGYTQIDAAAVLGKCQAWASIHLSRALSAISQAGYTLKGDALFLRSEEPTKRVRCYPVDPAILDQTFGKLPRPGARPRKS